MNSSRFPAVAGALVLTAFGLACQDAPPPTAAARSRGTLPAYTGEVSSAAAGGQPKSILPDGKSIGYLGDGAASTRDRARIEYHDRAVMTGAVHPYIIWYGQWADADVQIVGELLSTIGLSPYMTVSALYPNGAGAAPTGAVVYAGAITDEYSHGTTLSDADIADIVQQSFTSGILPLDLAGVYFVMGGADIDASSGYGSEYCALHGSKTFYSQPFKFVYVGHPSRAPSRCAPQSIGPNGTMAGDAVASLVAAELFNTVTNPEFTGWYDRYGFDAADKCAWTYGTTYTTPNGAKANMRLGARDYLIQQIWVPGRSGGTCALRR